MFTVISLKILNKKHLFFNFIIFILFGGLTDQTLVVMQQRKEETRKPNPHKE
jgi:hypothetical protein